MWWPTMFKHWRMIRWNANVSISSKLFSSCGVIEYKFSCQLKNPQLVGYHARQPWTTPAYWVPCPITMDHPSLLGTMPDNHGPPQLIEYHVQQPWTTPAYWVPCPTTMDHPSLLSTMSDNHGPPQLIGYHVRHPWTTPAYWVPCPTTMDHPSPGCPDSLCRRSAV